MNQSKSVFLTLLLGLIVLAGLDIVFNQGQTIAALMPDRTAVSIPQLDNQNLVNSVPNPSGVVIDTSDSGTVVYNQPPLVVTATPEQPQLVLEAPPTQTPTPTPQLTNFGATATAFFAPTPTPLTMIPLPTPELEQSGSSCHGGRSCPRATATPAPGR